MKTLERSILEQNINNIHGDLTPIDYITENKHLLKKLLEERGKFAFL